jgi:hypothetical protein
VLVGVFCYAMPPAVSSGDAWLGFQRRRGYVVPALSPCDIREIPAQCGGRRELRCLSDWGWWISFVDVACLAVGGEFVFR